MSVSATQIKMRVVTDADFCPKCGKDAEWQGPRYKCSPYTPSPKYPNEWLQFTCSVCGYIRCDPTNDTPKATPNPPPQGKDPSWEFQGIGASAFFRNLKRRVRGVGE